VFSAFSAAQERANLTSKTPEVHIAAVSAAETSKKPTSETPGVELSAFSAALFSVFYGPLGALFSLMFDTSLGFTDCNIQIPIGACLLFSFLFPHRGALYDYLNRRFHLYILNRDLLISVYLLKYI
jgi:hypothetical protein